MTSRETRIGIAAICKNEERFIKNFIEHHERLGFTDFIFVDTGSTDRTVDIIKECGHKVYSEFFPIVDFSKFRNKLWQRVLGNLQIDCVIMLDIDERIIGSRKEDIQALVNNSIFNAFEINRVDITGGDITTLKRILKTRDGKWSNSVHEHFDFYENNTLSQSNIKVLHLNSERIRSRKKFELYTQLCKNEYANDRQDYFYFLLQNIFNAADTVAMKHEWQRFKSRSNEANYFLTLILNMFFRYAVIIEDTEFETEIIRYVVATQQLHMLEKFESFKLNLYKVGITNFETNDFDFLGKPNTTVLSFLRSSLDDQLIQCITPLLNKMIQYGIAHSIHKEHDKIYVKFAVHNDIIFNKIYFSNLTKLEKLNMFKFCAMNKILREMYYEQ